MMMLRYQAFITYSDNGLPTDPTIAGIFYSIVIQAIPGQAGGGSFLEKQFDL